MRFITYILLLFQIRHFFQAKLLLFFLFFHENIYCGYLLEAPHRGASNEYPQYMFSWRNDKNMIWIPLPICIIIILAVLLVYDVDSSNGYM